VVHILQQILFLLALAVIAAAYAAVGQAGATGYIAAMALAGFAPDVIRPAALALTTLVAMIGTARFARAGHLTWQGTYSFILLGLPFSVLGGATHLPASIFSPVVGALLIAAAWQMARLARSAAPIDELMSGRPPLLLSLLAGAVIGFVAGVTGIGGGIILAPLLLSLRWLDTHNIVGAFQPIEFGGRSCGPMEYIAEPAARPPDVARGRWDWWVSGLVARRGATAYQRAPLHSFDTVASWRTMDVDRVVSAGSRGRGCLPLARPVSKPMVAFG
jgi:hypothetical protein